MRVKKVVSEAEYNRTYSGHHFAQKQFDGSYVVTYKGPPLTKTEVLLHLLDFANKHNLYVDYYTGCAEPGYDDRPIMKKILDWGEKYFKDKIEIDWSDEWTSCGNCGKAVRDSPDSYGWQSYFILLNNCELICGDCATVEDIIETYQNRIDSAARSWAIKKITGAGFHCVEEDPCFDSCRRYETGWHSGQNDTPQKALEDVIKALGDDEEWFFKTFDYIFCINDVGQFDVKWTILVREKEMQDG